MGTTDIEEQRYLCIAKHLLSVITRNMQETAPFFQEKKEDKEPCFEELERKFHKRHPLLARRYEVFIKRQPEQHRQYLYGAAGPTPDHPHLGNMHERCPQTRADQTQQQRHARRPEQCQQVGNKAKYSKPNTSREEATGQPGTDNASPRKHEEKKRRTCTILLLRGNHGLRTHA